LRGFYLKLKKIVSQFAPKVVHNQKKTRKIIKKREKNSKLKNPNPKVLFKMNSSFEL